MLIQVAITNWPNHPKRIEYFRRVTESLQSKLTAVGHSIQYVCSSETERDPKHPWFGDELIELCREQNIVLSWRDAPASLGGNMNAALRLCDAPVVFLVQDDWMLLEPLDIGPGAEYLSSHSDVDLIRYSWPGHMTRFTGDRDGWQIVDGDYQFSYGDDPQLRRPDFVQRFGEYREGGPHGISEGDMLYRLRKANAVILAAQKNYFCTIGDVASVIDEKRERAVQR
jgi:hypothetical protein